MNGSNFFKNKFGLVVNMNKSSSIKEFEKDVAKHGPSEIETRGHVFVVWFDSKYCLFKALTDRMLLKHKIVLSVQNFKFYDAVTKDKETLLHECEAESNETMLDERAVMKVTEREVFGFLWQKQKKYAKIRDDQVISRLLTNFIKNVSCKELTVEENGLTVIFSTTAQYRTALIQFCPSPVPDQAQLVALARKFTLLPSKGSYGLFSRKRINAEQFRNITECIVKNNVIWFSDKLAMFKVLRDPQVTKLYPTLFVDCRNIYILSSKNMLAEGKHFSHETFTASLEKKSPTMSDESILQGSVTPMPAQDKPSKPSSVNNPPKLRNQHNKQVSLEPSNLDQDVVTRAATTKILVSESSNIQSPVPPDAKTSRKTVIANIEVPTIATSSKLNDTDIVTAATPSDEEKAPSSVSCPLLADLFNERLGCGKFGIIPTARMVRTGYKQCRVPVITRSKVMQEDLFLENKECYRGKNVTEAAGIIKNVTEAA